MELNQIIEEKEHIHGYFGLSYANYLVIPRLVLQSMPEEWQKQFVFLLEQIPEILGKEWEPEGGYHVMALNEDGQKWIDPYSNYERGRRRLEKLETPHSVPLQAPESPVEA